MVWASRPPPPPLNRWFIHGKNRRQQWGPLACRVWCSVCITDRNLTNKTSLSHHRCHKKSNLFFNFFLPFPFQTRRLNLPVIHSPFHLPKRNKNTHTNLLKTPWLLWRTLMIPDRCICPTLWVVFTSSFYPVFVWDQTLVSWMWQGCGQ